MLGLAADLLQNIFHKPLEFVFQILAVYLFVATPCLAGWIANGGKREEIGIPIAGSIMLSLLFGGLIYFFTDFQHLHHPITIFPKQVMVCMDRAQFVLPDPATYNIVFVSNLPGSNASSNSQAWTPEALRANRNSID